jgi:hypothetical protein
MELRDSGSIHAAMLIAAWKNQLPGPPGAKPCAVPAAALRAVSGDDRSTAAEDTVREYERAWTETEFEDARRTIGRVYPSGAGALRPGVKLGVESSRIRILEGPRVTARTGETTAIVGAVAQRTTMAGSRVKECTCIKEQFELRRIGDRWIIENWTGRECSTQDKAKLTEPEG